MDLEKRIARRQTEEASAASQSVSRDSSVEPLLEQANPWIEVSREARESCEKGADAEETLKHRRNRPGQ